MVGCLRISACASRLAVFTFAPCSLQQTSLRGRSNALALCKKRETVRERIGFARVAYNPTKAALGDAPDDEKHSSKFTSEDWQYLGKLFAGCTAGAGLIKYGSILLPQVTQPDLSTALIVIAAPVIASVVLLSASSSSGEPPPDS